MDPASDMSLIGSLRGWKCLFNKMHLQNPYWNLLWSKRNPMPNKSTPPDSPPLRSWVAVPSAASQGSGRQWCVEAHEVLAAVSLGLRGTCHQGPDGQLNRSWCTRMQEEDQEQGCGCNGERSVGAIEGRLVTSPPLTRLTPPQGLQQSGRGCGWCRWRSLLGLQVFWLHFGRCLQ